MTRYDVKREFRQCYAPANTDWALVDVPAQQFIAVDGRGEPNTSVGYARAVEALHAVAYTIKFTSKRTLGRDFVVGPLEGLCPRLSRFPGRATAHTCGLSSRSR